MKYDTVKICSMNSLFEWLERYGVHPNNKGLARCPFHNEKTASFKVYPNGTYHCFGCGAHGDVITFVMGVKKISFREACKLLDREATATEKKDIETRKNQRGAKLKQIALADRRYWEAFDDLKFCEDVINKYKPQNNADEPHEAFLLALRIVGYLRYKLSVAENERTSSKK